MYHYYHIVKSNPSTIHKILFSEKSIIIINILPVFNSSFMIFLRFANNQFQSQIYKNLNFFWAFLLQNNDYNLKKRNTYPILYDDQIYGWRPIHLLRQTLETRITNNISPSFDAFISMHSQYLSSRFHI